jgi:hypothetical protein
MKSIRWSIVVLLFSLIPAIAQNKDSLLEDLYRQGLIGKDAYYHSISQAKLRNKIDQNIQKLRGQLKFKFALNFLLEYKPEQRISMPPHPILDIYMLPDSEFVKKIECEDKEVLEGFYCGNEYKLYKINSFIEGQDFYLLAESSLSQTGALFLLGSDTTKWLFLDVFEFYAHNGKYHLDKMNGHDLIKVCQSPWGTDYYSEEEAYLGIINSKFKTLFGNRTIEIHNAENGDNIRTTRKLLFMNVTNSGLQDIVEDEKVEKVADEGQIHDFNDYYKLQPLQLISMKQTRFVWNGSTFTSDKAK